MKYYVNFFPKITYSLVLKVDHDDSHLLYSFKLTKQFICLYPMWKLWGGILLYCPVSRCWFKSEYISESMSALPRHRSIQNCRLSQYDHYEREYSVKCN